MENLQRQNLDKSSELRNLAENWVNTEFNYIQLSVIERLCKAEDLYLVEYISDNENEYLKDFINYDATAEDLKDLKKEFKEDTGEKAGKNLLENDYFIEWLKEHSVFQDYKDRKQDENYPMWGTLFEFRHEPSEQIKDAAKEAGFGLIEGLDDFNTLLFVAGAGYSFYAQHWIPLFLSMPYNEKVKEEFKGVNFEMM